MFIRQKIETKMQIMLDKFEASGYYNRRNNQWKGMKENRQRNRRWLGKDKQCVHSTANGNK